MSQLLDWIEFIGCNFYEQTICSLSLLPIIKYVSVIIDIKLRFLLSKFLLNLDPTFSDDISKFNSKLLQQGVNAIPFNKW